MSRTLVVSLPEMLYRRLRRTLSRGPLKKQSHVVQEALRNYFDSAGPDPDVIRRWKGVYEKSRDAESESAMRLLNAQSGSLGKP